MRNDRRQRRLARTMKADPELWRRDSGDAAVAARAVALRVEPPEASRRSALPSLSQGVEHE